MISRRNRSPSGRSNGLSSFPSINSPISMSPIDTTRKIERNNLKTSHSSRFDQNYSQESTRPETSQLSTRFGQSQQLASTRLSTARSRTNSNRSEDDVDLMTLPTNEILARLHHKAAEEKRKKLYEETLSLGGFNSYSRPRPSTEYPHRSVFLDSKVNNFSPSKTRTELLQKIKSASIPHESYDIDGDGYVSQDDYKLAKRFDFDGNGVIDPYERNIAKHVIADEFFKSHQDNIHVFGPDISSVSHEENVKKLENSNCFERTLTLLKEVENSLRGRSSKEMVACMESSDINDKKYNFYSNKFDTTAWNTVQNIPLTERSLASIDNSGSRSKLLQSRKYHQRNECEIKLQEVYDKQPKYSTQRLALITNPDLW